MTLRYANKQEIEQWDQFSGDNFLQSATFASVKTPRWNPLYIVGPRKTGVLVLTRRITGLGTLAYIPAGPNAKTGKALEALIESLKEFLQKERPDIFLLKVEPRLPGFTPKSKLLRPAAAIQTDATIILPVSDDINTVGRRARRYIRVGEREGIEVKAVPLTKDTMRTMYSLMSSAFGGRGMPGLRSLPYYERFWTTFHKAGQGDLYFAYDKETPVAGVYVVKNGTMGLYKDGGSLHGRQSKGATYLIHWRIMQDLHAEGYKWYDLWGSPPSAQLDDPHHPLAGLAAFKTAFSTTVTDFPGVFDVVINSSKYERWQKVYPVLRRYLLTVRKEGFY